MLQVLFTGTISACFEIINDEPYYAPSAYEIWLNGQHVKDGDTNVFSLFDLTPSTDYSVEVKGKEVRGKVTFRTASESCAVDVREFGAKGDGVTNDTTAIQNAINCLPKGGRLIFPAGTYLTFPLMLKNHIILQFTEGATLLGSVDRESYPIIPGVVKDQDKGKDILIGTFEGLAVPMYQALITAEYARDITIVGPGTVDGNAQNSDFWKNFESFPAARPRLIFLNHCKSVTIHGIHACNSASWQLHPFFSKDLGFYDISISAPKVSPNTDALDPESCDHVKIVGCKFSVGDDCIAIKSGKIELGQKYNQPADHHMIRNCLMEHGHGAITLGSEIGAGVRHLTVSHCYFRNTDRGLRIKTRRGRGKNSRIDAVLFERIRMEGVLTPFVINMYYNCCDPDRYTEYVYSREELPVDDRTPSLGSFCFSNIECTDAEVAACYIDGLPEMPIEKVEFRKVKVSFAKDAKPGIPAMENFAKERCRLGLYLDHVREVHIEDVSLEGVDGEKLITDHCDEVITEGFV